MKRELRWVRLMVPCYDYDIETGEMYAAGFCPEMVGKVPPTLEELEAEIANLKSQPKG